MIIYIGQQIENTGELIIRLALLICLSAFCSNLEASNSKITNFKLTTCNTRHCIKLTSPVAQTSYFDTQIIVLQQTKLEIYDQTGNKKITSFNSLEATIDSEINRVMLKNLNQDDSKDLSYNLKTGNYRLFDKSISMNN